MEAAIGNQSRRSGVEPCCPLEQEVNEMGKVAVESEQEVESELGVMESGPVEIVEESEFVGVVKESETAMGVVQEVVEVMKEQF